MEKDFQQIYQKTQKNQRMKIPKKTQYARLALGDANAKQKMMIQSGQEAILYKKMFGFSMSMVKGIKGI